MNIKRYWIPLLLLLTSLSACADPDGGQNSAESDLVEVLDTEQDSEPDGPDLVGVDDESDLDPTLLCTSGERRCYLGELQDCVDEQWASTENCGSSSLCDPEIGCMECFPGIERLCVENEVRQCTERGEIGGLIEECTFSACVSGACADPVCATGTQYIYVVDDEYRLLRFNAADDAHTFTSLGHLSCPAAQSWPEWGGSATPFSMSVDRQGHAWVLYTSGEIFLVDINSTELTCTRSGFEPGSGGFELFGMGFVSDASGSADEHLYIVGGEVNGLLDGQVGRIDPEDFSLETLGPIPNAQQSPEFTGSGAGKLFGYFPGSNNAFVAELSKEDGSIVQDWDIPNGEASAWAFAQWGGRFYIFTSTSSTNRVLRLDPSTGQTQTVLSNHPYRIVGAGVSTCADWN